MPRPQVPDTTVFIDAMRRADRRQELRQLLASSHTWLSAVVITELYAGTRSPNDALLVDRIVAAMESVDRVLTPTGREWRRAGQLLARRIRLEGSLRPRDHLADVLILLSAASLHGTIITANLRHFTAWQRLARAAGFDVTVRGMSEPA